MNETPTPIHDDDLFTLAGVYRVLPVHRYTAYAWTMPPPDAETEVNGRRRPVWKASTLRHNWQQRYPARRQRLDRWKKDVVKAAKRNLVEGVPVPLPASDLEWIEGGQEGTRELIVRYVETVA